VDAKQTAKTLPNLSTYRNKFLSSAVSPKPNTGKLSVVKEDTGVED
jgi:hypothetical protein